MMVSTSSRASACDNSHLIEVNGYEVCLSDSEIQPSDMDSSYQGGSSHCERINNIFHQSHRRHRSMVSCLTYGIFLALALYSIRIEEYVKNDLVSTLAVDTHEALKYKAIGLMDQFESFELHVESNNLQDQEDAALVKEFEDEGREQYDIETSKQLYQERDFYLNLVEQLKHFQVKLASKLNKTDAELREVRSKLSKEEGNETTLLNDIASITHSRESDWFCSQVQDFCDLVDNVVGLRRQANSEAVLILHDSDLMNNLTQEEANEVLKLVDSEVWIERYEDVASTLYIAAVHYELDIQRLTNVVLFDNASVKTISSAKNFADAREQTMNLYFQENTNKSKKLFAKAEIDRQNAIQSSLYATAFACICLLYFTSRLITHMMTYFIKYPLEIDTFLGNLSVHRIGGNLDYHWNSRTLSNCVQHLFIFMITVGALNIQYNDLIRNPQSSEVIVSFIVLASIIQTTVLHFLPNLLMEVLPALRLHEHNQDTLLDTCTNIPMCQILKYSMMRFLLLLGLFTLEFLVAWLVVPQYIFNSAASVFWTHWYIRIGVIFSIVLHITLFEKIFDEDRISPAFSGDDHSTLCSVGDFDDELSYENEENKSTIYISSNTKGVRSTEKTPLVLRTKTRPCKQTGMESLPVVESQSQGSSTWWPFLVLQESTSGSVASIDSTSHKPVSTQFYVNFRDDLAKLLFATDVFVVASSVYVIRNCYRMLYALHDKTSMITSFFHIAAFAVIIVMSVVVIITLVHIVLCLVAVFGFESKLERNQNHADCNEYSRVAKGIFVEDV